MAKAVSYSDGGIKPFIHMLKEHLLQRHCIYTRQLRQHGFSHMFFFVPWQERLTLV